MFIILNSNGIIAQNPELVVNVTSPGKINFYGNDLFIAQEDRISKINITDLNPSVIDFITNTHPLDLRFENDYMYVSESNINSFSDRIYKVNMTNSSSTDIITNSSLNGIEINSNNLYVTDFSIPSNIFKVDVASIVTPTNIEFTPIFNNSLIFETYNMFIDNNILYLAQTDPDFVFIRISKIDLTASPSTSPTPIFTGFNSIPRSFVIKDNYMYIALADNISKIDITQPSPTPTIVTTNVSDPQGLAIKDCYLYISEKNSNKITKLNLCPLSTEIINPTKPISLYPNPSENQIKVSGLAETQKYKILNILGIKVSEGIIYNEEDISIQNLKSGIYFLKFENSAAIKFIKK